MWGKYNSNWFQKRSKWCPNLVTPQQALNSEFSFARAFHANLCLESLVKRDRRIWGLQRGGSKKKQRLAQEQDDSSLEHYPFAQLMGANEHSQHVDQARDTMKRKCMQDSTWFSALSALCPSDQPSLASFRALYWQEVCDASRLGQGVGFLLNCILSPLADMTAVRGDILIVRVIIQVNHDTYWTFRLCYLTERPIFILRWILRWFLVELSFLPMFREETRKAIVFEMGLVWCVEFHVWRYGMCWDSGQK